MKNTSLTAFVAAIVFTATVYGVVYLIGFISNTSPVQVPSLGGVTVGNEYTATTTENMLGNTGHNVIVANAGATPRPVTLGSVIITSVAAKQMRIWNATSTTDIASTTVAYIKAGTAEGTLVFDAMLDRGLIVETPAGFNGTSTITYRR